MRRASDALLQRAADAASDTAADGWRHRTMIGLNVIFGAKGTFYNTILREGFWELNLSDVRTLLRVTYRLISEKLPLVARTLEFPYTPVTEIDELLPMADATVDVLNDMRAHYDLAPMDFALDDIRLMEPSVYRELRKYMGDESEDDAAVHSPLVGKIFVQFDRAQFASDSLYRLQIVSTMIHEIVHSGTRGTEGLSTLLSEGITEKIASDIMDGLFYEDSPHVKGSAAEIMRKINGVARREIVNPDYVSSVDIEFGDDRRRFTVKPHIGGYAKQLAFVRMLERRAPEVYDALIESAFTDSGIGALLVLGARYGMNFINMLKEEDSDWEQILYEACAIEDSMNEE